MTSAYALTCILFRDYKNPGADYALFIKCQDKKPFDLLQQFGLCVFRYVLFWIGYSDTNKVMDG